MYVRSVYCVYCASTRKKKTSRPEIVIAKKKRLFLFPFSSNRVFSAVIFPDLFYIGARTRVNALRGVRQDETRETQEQPRRVLDGTFILATERDGNRRNLYDPRKQIIGATLTSRLITLGRTPTSAF